MNYIAFLRGINVGGHKKLPMAELQQFVTRLGFRHPRTWLQSGNLIFEAGTSSTLTLEKQLEAGCEKHLGLRTEFFVRKPAQLAKLIAGNPFKREEKSDPSHLVAVLLKSQPEAADIKALQAAIKGRERVHCEEARAYIVYPDGIGNSKLTAAVIDSRLRTRGTARNWNTILKLAVMAGEGRA